MSDRRSLITAETTAENSLKEILIAIAKIQNYLQLSSRQLALLDWPKPVCCDELRITHLQAHIIVLCTSSVY